MRAPDKAGGAGSAGRGVRRRASGPALGLRTKRPLDTLSEAELALWSAELTVWQHLHP